VTRYLHKFHNAPSMARLRSLSRAAVAPNGNDEGGRISANCGQGVRGFEPPFDHLLGEYAVADYVS
jgi:hypothetical protein